MTKSTEIRERIRDIGKLGISEYKVDEICHILDLLNRRMDEIEEEMRRPRFSETPIGGDQ